MDALKGMLSRTLTGPQLRKVYDVLEDEEHPYDATVRTVKDKKAPSIYAHTPRI